MLFGVATALGFCRGGNLGQCAAHYIMGSAFIGYAAILVIMLNVGGEWLKKRGCSQEMLDSSVIMVWVRLRCVYIVLQLMSRASSTHSRSIMADRGRTKTCSIR
jgi:Ni/Fe-hydrogenase subunit HybB-like protein